MIEQKLAKKILKLLEGQMPAVQMHVMLRVMRNLVPGRPLRPRKKKKGKR